MIQYDYYLAKPQIYTAADLVIHKWFFEMNDLSCQCPELSAKQLSLHCVSKGDIQVLHSAFNVMS